MAFSKEMGRRKIEEMESSSRGGIYKVSFGSHSKMVVDANPSSDIPELSEIDYGHTKIRYITFLRMEVG